MIKLTTNSKRTAEGAWLYRVENDAPYTCAHLNEPNETTDSWLPGWSDWEPINENGENT